VRGLEPEAIDQIIQVTDVGYKIIEKSFVMTTLSTAARTSTITIHRLFRLRHWWI